MKSKKDEKNLKKSKGKQEVKKEKKVKVEKADKKEQKGKKEKFFKNVLKEMKRVTWPDKKYMVKYSIATFAIIIFSSLYFYLIFVLFSLVKELR